MAIFGFITVLSLNLKITEKSKFVPGIQLENLDALACYSLYLSEAGPLAPRSCCEPWYYFCYYDDWSGYTFNGWPAY